MTHEALKRAKELEKQIGYLEHLYDTIITGSNSFLVISDKPVVDQNIIDDWYKTLKSFLIVTDDKLKDYVRSSINYAKDELSNL